VVDLHDVAAHGLEPVERRLDVQPVTLGREQRVDHFGLFDPQLVLVVVVHRLPVLAWIALYSYTKRFTWLCHVFLGGALAASPPAAAVAVDPAALAHAGPGLAVWWLAGMVLFWVAGFDVIYATLDVASDRRTGIRSLPAALGVRRALWVSAGMHALAVLALAMLYWRFLSGPVAAVAVAVVAMLLIAEQRLSERVDFAFFQINIVVGFAVLVAVVLGVRGI